MFIISEYIRIFYFLFDFLRAFVALWKNGCFIKEILTVQILVANVHMTLFSKLHELSGEGDHREETCT